MESDLSLGTVGNMTNLKKNLKSVLSHHYLTIRIHKQRFQTGTIFRNVF